MRRRVVAVGAALLCILVLGSTVSADADERPRTEILRPVLDAGLVTVDAPGITFTHGAGAQTSTAATSPAEATSTEFGPPANDDFVFEFHGTDASQEAVFEAAGGVWSDVLEVEVPVVTRVRTRSFSDRNVLGGAEPTDLHANDISFPMRNVWFVSAQANQFAGRDLDPSKPEIDIVISSDFDFYEGIDDDVPDDQISLLNLALHELAHGLGHITLARRAGTSWSITWPTPLGTQLPLAYDLLLVNGAHRRLTTLPADALGTALTSRVLWSGTEAIAVEGGMLPELYAPPSFRSGSSTSHLDERSYPGAMMSPDLANGEVHLEIPALTQAMFADLGWGLEVHTANEALVTATSRDFIKRFPTPTQLRRVIAWLENGTTTNRQLVQAYGSHPASLGAEVDRHYLAILGRVADPVERARASDQLRTSTSSATLMARLLGSEEYFTRSGSTTEAWVTTLYRDVLGRESDEAGRGAWIALTEAWGSRSAVAMRFVQSEEARAVRVTQAYRRLLGREPDAAGLRAWTDVLSNGSDLDLQIRLASSSEYEDRSFRRFG